jgi:hypothetical protein
MCAVKSCHMRSYKVFFEGGYHRFGEMCFCIIKDRHADDSAIFLRAIEPTDTTIRKYSLEDYNMMNYARCVIVLYIRVLTYWLTYLLTPWSTVLLKKLTGSQLLQKLSAFYETRRFFNAFTIAGHLSLPWARSIQSMARIPFPEDPFYCYSPIYTWVFQVV